MGIKRNLSKLAGMRNMMNPHMENIKSELLKPMFDEIEMYNAHTSMASEDLWKKFDLPTPPLSPCHDTCDSLDLENINMPFDIDTEDLIGIEFDEAYQEILDDIHAEESPPGIDPNVETCLNLEANLIQDIMWSAPAKQGLKGEEPQMDKHRLRCNSCSNPPNTACVAPDEVLMETNIGGTMSQTKVHNLGIETPSDSEEEIDVVTVEKQQQVIMSGKRKFKSEDDSYPKHFHGNKTVTIKIENKPGNVHTVTKCASVRQRIDCPTDVHNYSLPVSSLKRVHSYPSSPITHKSKKLKRDISIPSNLRKVAQKLKSSVGSCSSRSSSDSEDFNDVGKRTQHNVLERKRRTDLKNSFFHLRDSVPELEGQERAPKVTILRKAAQYIHRLIEEQNRQETEIEQLQMKREKLKRHLAKVREY